MIVSDCQKLAEEPGDSIVSARAAFQLAFAYATGFTGSKDLVEAIHWFERSSAKGFGLAELYLPSLRALQSEEKISHEAFNQRYLRCNQQALKTKFTATFLDGLEDDFSFTDGDPLLIEVLTKTISEDRHALVNTRLLLASKLGKTETVEWLLDGNGTVDLNLTDKEGCTALHWLFMFPEDDIFRISTKLGKEQADFIYIGEINDAITIAPSSTDAVAMNSWSLNIDPQLPLQLAGTPLSFAVATCCKTAVRALLLTGADPLRGTGPLPGNPSVQNFSAVHIATRLHMADLLGILLNHIHHRHLLSATAFTRLLDGLSLSMATATSIERSIIHGSYTIHAAEETIAVLHEFYNMSAQDLRAWALLMPAVLQADLEVCEVILSAKAFQQTSTAVLKPKELDALIAVCTEAACLVGSDLSLSTRILEFGISVGASANGMFPDQDGRKPVFIAIEHHQPPILDWLIDVQHVDLNVLDENGLTPLHSIVASGFSANYNIAKLIQNGASPTIESKGQLRPIDLVMTDKTVPEFTTLLQYVDPWEVQGFLEKSISSECPEIVTAVIEYVKQTDSVPDLDLQFALDIAAISSSAKIVRVILDAGADPGTTNLEAFSPLHQAASFGNANALEVLHKAGADVNKLSCNTEGATPLICTIMTMGRGGDMSIGARQCCKYLLENGANVNCADGDGNTPLSILLKGPRETRDNAIIEEVLKKGADPNLIDDRDLCIIFQSVIEFNFNLAEMLIKYKTRVDRTNSQGDTILHNCAKLSSDATIDECKDFKLYGLVEELLKAGADPHCRNLSGETPVDEAIYTDNGPIFLALLEHLKNSTDAFSRAQHLTGRDKDFPIVFRKKTIPIEDETEHQKHFLRSTSGEPFNIDDDQEFEVPSKEAEALANAWRKAIYFGSWSCVCASLRTGTHGPTEYMTRKAALALFTYAMQNEISDTIIKFIGDRETLPDPYLGSIWDSIRKHLPHYGNMGSTSTLKPAIGLPYNHSKGKRWPTINRYISKSKNQLAIRLKQKRPKNLEELVADKDVPPELGRHAIRLQYMDSIGGYSRSMPAEILFSMGVFETEGEGKQISELYSTSMPMPSVLLYEDEDDDDETPGDEGPGDEGPGREGPEDGVS